MRAEENCWFIACHDCGQLQPVVDPLALSPPDEVGQQILQAYDEFLSEHEAHRTCVFRRDGSESHADRPFWDPLAVITFQVTDGERLYVVRTERLSIEDARTYRFTAGQLELEPSQVEIDPADLCRGLDLEFFPYALRQAKLDQFSSAIRQVVRHIHSDDLTIAFDVADDPTLSIATMPDAVYEELLTRCAAIFDPCEFPRVAQFLRENRAEDGLLTLRVRRTLPALIP